MVSDKLAPNILVVEQDKVMNANICNTIERYGFDATRVHDLSKLDKLIQFNFPHVAVLGAGEGDVMELAQSLCVKGKPYNLPVIFLVDQEKNEKEFLLKDNDLVRVLKKPVLPNEIMVSIRELLRKATPVFLDKVMSYKDISLDLYTMKVTKGGSVYSFGPTEFKILQLLMQRPSTIYTRRQIIDYVWGDDKEIADRTIDVHINRIRTLLKVNEDRNPLIKTIRSAGYCLD